VLCLITTEVTDDLNLFHRKNFKQCAENSHGIICLTRWAAERKCGRRQYIVCCN